LRVVSGRSEVERSFLSRGRQGRVGTMLTAGEPWLVLFPFWSGYGGVSLESLVSIYWSLILDTGESNCDGVVPNW
jgi:hypothetical protein